MQSSATGCLPALLVPLQPVPLHLLPLPLIAGMSVMEMSHRGKEFQSIIDNAEANLRALLAIPDDYAVLFMQARTHACTGCWLASQPSGSRQQLCCAVVLCSLSSGAKQPGSSMPSHLTGPASLPSSPPCRACCLQGGASSQFSAIPLNLCEEGDVVDYIVTGSWSKKAAGGGQQK
jgi:hypothetical protein